MKIDATQIFIQLHKKVKNKDKTEISKMQIHSLF